MNALLLLDDDEIFIDGPSGGIVIRPDGRIEVGGLVYAIERQEPDPEPEQPYPNRITP